MKITEKQLRKIIREEADWARRAKERATHGLKEEIRKRLERKMGPRGQGAAWEIAAAFEGAAYDYLHARSPLPDGLTQAERDKLEATVQWVASQAMELFDVLVDELDRSCNRAFEKLEE